VRPGHAGGGIRSDAAAGCSDEEAVRARFGVAPSSIPDWLALVGDSADGSGRAAAGRAVRPRRCSPASGRLESIPDSEDGLGRLGSGAAPPRGEPARASRAGVPLPDPRHAPHRTCLWPRPRRPQVAWTGGATRSSPSSRPRQPMMRASTGRARLGGWPAVARGVGGSTRTDRARSGRDRLERAGHDGILHDQRSFALPVPGGDVEVGAADGHRRPGPPAHDLGVTCGRTGPSAPSQPGTSDTAAGSPRRPPRRGVHRGVHELGWRPPGGRCRSRRRLGAVQRQDVAEQSPDPDAAPHRAKERALDLELEREPVHHVQVRSGVSMSARYASSVRASLNPRCTTTRAAVGPAGPGLRDAEGVAAGLRPRLLEAASRAATAGPSTRAAGVEPGYLPPRRARGQRHLGEVGGSTPRARLRPPKQGHPPVEDGEACGGSRCFRSSRDGMPPTGREPTHRDARFAPTRSSREFRAPNGARAGCRRVHQDAHCTARAPEASDSAPRTGAVTRRRRRCNLE